MSATENCCRTPLVGRARRIRMAPGPRVVPEGAEEDIQCHVPAGLNHVLAPRFDFVAAWVSQYPTNLIEIRLGWIKLRLRSVDSEVEEAAVDVTKADTLVGILALSAQCLQRPRFDAREPLWSERRTTAKPA